METLVKELFDFTGRELHEAAWHANLPVHHGVALYSFFQAFKDQKRILTRLDDKSKTAEFALPLHIKRTEKIFRTKISYEQVLRGWGRSFKASPRALYDSIYQVYDQIGSEIEDHDKFFFNSGDLNWHGKFRGVHPPLIRESMESYLLGYFEKHHEGVLISRSGNLSQSLGEPKIFWEVLKEFPLTRLSKTIVADEVEHNREGGITLTPCSEYVLEIPDEEFNDEYYPSEAVLMDLFWGMYLKRLSDEKRYGAWNNNASLKHFISRGNNALERLMAK